jgi:hypothetical protein
MALPLPPDLALSLHAFQPLDLREASAQTDRLLAHEAALFIAVARRWFAIHPGMTALTLVFSGRPENLPRVNCARSFVPCHCPSTMAQGRSTACWKAGCTGRRSGQRWPPPTISLPVRRERGRLTSWQVHCQLLVGQLDPFVFDPLGIGKGRG